MQKFDLRLLDHVLLHVYMYKHINAGQFVQHFVKAGIVTAEIIVRRTFQTYGCSCPHTHCMCYVYAGTCGCV